MVGTGRGAQLGILIKGPEVLESTRRVDTIVLDKTGTVTTGEMALVDVVAGERPPPRREVLRLAGSLEDASEHPIARAIAAGARDRGAELVPVESFASTQGLGVQGVVDGRAVVAGRERFLDDWALHLAGRSGSRQGRRRGRGPTAVLVGWDGAATGVLVVADTVKPTSAEAVARLRALGLRPVLLTGDNERAARRGRRPGRHRRGRRRGPARGQGRRRPPAPGRGPGRGHGRRRRERRRRPGPGRPRPGHGHRHRRGHRGQRPHPRARRPPLGGRRHPPVPPDPRHHQGQPVLGLRLQRGRPPPRRRRPPQPDAGRRRHGPLQRLRRHQQPPPPPLPYRARSTI